MRLKVPRFLDLEDKMIGPLTLKQFLFLIVGGGVSFVIWYLFNLWAFIIISIPIVGFFGSLAFLKVNGRPFLNFVSSILNFVTKPRLYIWKKEK